MYTKDQWAVMSALALDAPKRPKMKVSDIAARSFGADDSSDRRARNAFRKPRTQGHVEIAERGEYRLTPTGLSYFKQSTKSGAEPSAVRVTKTKKAAGKKAKTKKGVKSPATKKATKKAATKKVAKKPAAKKPATKKTATKKATSRKVPALPKRNGVRKAKSSGPVTLSF